jgi:hypothetical protein
MTGSPAATDPGAVLDAGSFIGAISASLLAWPPGELITAGREEIGGAADTFVSHLR